jgi:hypothetical protein
MPGRPAGSTGQQPTGQQPTGQQPTGQQPTDRPTSALAACNLLANSGLQFAVRAGGLSLLVILVI